MNLLNTKHFMSAPKLCVKRRRSRVVLKGTSSGDPNISEPESSEIGATNNFTLFVNKVRNDEISDVYITSGSEDRVIYQNKVSIDDDHEFVKTNVIVSDSLFEEMIDHDVQIHLQDASFMSSGIFTIVLAAFVYSVFFRFISASLLPFQSGENKEMYKEVDKTDDGVKLSDVAGIDEIVEEIAEFVDFLKNPGKYHEAGAKIPTGCLLYGSPGTGKTMIAKAVANEADVPFISCSASEFVELFVGMGASRVRTLFEQARDKAPCIIFIDEIDSIGKKRTGGNSGGNDEREQTLNQILTEMDGFKSTEKQVVVFGATNRLDTLDEALIRPGRFDRKIKVPMPNTMSRKQILKTYIDKVKTTGINLDKLASRTRGMAGADLMNVVNEAAIMSVRQRSSSITVKHFEQAIEKISIGIPKQNNQHSAGDSYRVAIHELGHAFIGSLEEDFDEVDKISILSVGDAAGITSFIPKETSDSMFTYKYYIQKIKVALGGHAAEDVIFEHINISSGATSDFQQVSSIAYHLIKDLGYSKLIGKLSLSEKPISEHTETIIDQEVRQLVDKCYSEVKHVIKMNKPFIKYAAEELVSREVMTGSELNELYTSKKI